jgi:hypothetical protein
MGKRSWALLLFVFALAPASRAVAGLIDTLSGLTPGDTIGCDYTFQNGDPSIPCATDTVAADGTVSFLKPDAAYDNIEYFDVTTGKDILELITTENTPIESQLTPGTEYPIVESTGTFSSFFDVFFDISIPSFDGANLDVPGTFNIGDDIEFNDGQPLNFTFPTGITLPGYTGEVQVVGFDTVTNSPEPSALLLFATGLALLCLKRDMRLPAASVVVKRHAR